MRPVTFVRPNFVLLSLAALLSACTAGSTGGESAESSSATASSINHELFGGVAESSFRHYLEPEVARVAYAAPTLNGCTGTMIGPNVMMSASHCGNDDKDITFLTFTDDDPHAYVTDGFKCRILINTFHHSDLALYFCDPNGLGENPGDKYGYLDFDSSAPTVGQSVFSLVRHPISSLGITDGQLYSLGKISSTTSTIWPGAPANDQGPANLPFGMHMDMWGEPGASGSSHVNTANGRILVGPLSTGDISSRNALSMRTYLQQGSVDGWAESGWQTGVHDTTLTSLGVTPSSFSGRVDKDNNFLFDVQESIERVRGENRRDWINLGFDSERRNALWDRDTSTTSFLPSGPWATINVTYPSFTGGWEVFTHRRLHLEAATKYRISLRTYATKTDRLDNVKVLFKNGGAVSASRTLPIVANSAWQTHTFEMTTTAANPDLVFSVPGVLSLMLADLTIVKEGAAMDFESADERSAWKNPQTGFRAWILPRGEVRTKPDFAGLVRPNPAGTSGEYYTLANDSLGLADFKTYRVCFDTTMRDATWGVGRIRVTSGGTEVLHSGFNPPTSPGAWARTCTSNFTMLNGPAHLELGTMGPSGAYYVDRVTIERQPSFSDHYAPFVGGAPFDMYPAGSEPNSSGSMTTLGACSVAYAGGVHPGKLLSWGGCSIGYGGREIMLTDGVVLNGVRPGSDHWVWGSGSIPANAVQGGFERGAPLYVCRAYYGGGWHPGKVVGGGCNIGWGGAEQHLASYQVLTLDP